MSHAIAWSDSLTLHHPALDRTHQEFVALLRGLAEAAAAPNAAEADFRPRLLQLQQHTEAHFAEEERWMAALGQGCSNCHAFQHAQVLNVLREVAARLAAGSLADPPAVMAMVAAELHAWFLVHAPAFDAPLVEQLAAAVEGLPAPG